jgi:hypothetical protein
MHLHINDLEPDMPHWSHRDAAVEVAAHLRDAASDVVIDWSRLAHVAGLFGFDLDVDLELIRTGPTPRANLRRFSATVRNS